MSIQGNDVTNMYTSVQLECTCCAFAWKLELFLCCYRFGNLTFKRPFPNSLVPCFKKIRRANCFIRNEFDLHKNESLGGTHFHTNGFTRSLVLKQRQKNLMLNNAEKIKCHVIHFKNMDEQT